MKIMQINTWQGRLLRPLLALIKSENPDIIFAQEIYNFPSPLSINSPWNYFDTAGRIAAENNYQASYFSPESTFPMFEARLEYGNAIFSKFPFKHTSTHYTGGHEAIHLEAADDYDSNIGRNFQHASIEVPSGTLNLINHHGHWVNQSLGDEISGERLQEVATYVQSLTGPTIFAGDLNLSPDSPALQSFISAVKLDNPVVTSGAASTLSEAHYVKHGIICDYIMASPSLKISAFEVSAQLVSDHRALIIQIDV